MPLYGPDGKTVLQSDHKKGAPPKTGEAFGAWAGRDVTYMQMPGGSLIGFDLSKLEVADYRVMRDHYQVNASLAVLSFMQHQSEWHVECENKKIAEACEADLREIWTPLNRALATANWAGYSPNVLQWENDIQNNTVVLGKIKDLIPEECAVNWKLVDGWAPPGQTPPKYKVYDGFKQFGTPYPVPPENSLWYPLLMENGDYYGRKLLRPAFISWYFSILVHLFANRYYERFGEPVPVGRASFDDEVTVDGKQVRGNEYMLSILKELRNRSVVVLPNDKTDFGNSRAEYDYDIEYLESQMRGADFERYMTRLDEEISIGLFTPILLLRTADVGSYNLGVGHMQMYLWMLNAMNNDRKQYIDQYILSRMADYKFSPNAPRPKIRFRKLGNQNAELIRALLTELVKNGKVEPDLVELGEMAGLTFTEIQGTVDTPVTDPNADPRVGRPDRATDGDTTADPGFARAKETALEILTRVTPQVTKGFQANKIGPGFTVNMGFKKRMDQVLNETGASGSADELYGRMDRWFEDAVSVGTDAYPSPDAFMDMFGKVLEGELVRVYETN